MKGRPDRSKFRMRVSAVSGSVLQILSMSTRTAFLTLRRDFPGPSGQYARISIPPSESSEPAAAISAAGLALSAGCASWTRDGVTPDSYENVTSNGGFAVQTDDYVYFVNGSELNTADNTYEFDIQLCDDEDLF